MLKQIVALERELATALASDSDEQYVAWQRQAAELRESSKLAQALLPATDSYLKAVERGAVNRAMVTAALAIAAEGAPAAAAHVDPSSGKPFVYQQVPGGFELQSTYLVNDKPLKIFFPTP